MSADWDDHTARAIKKAPGRLRISWDAYEYGWQASPVPETGSFDATEYVRADRYAAALAEIDDLKAAYAKAAVRWVDSVYAARKSPVVERAWNSPEMAAGSALSPLRVNITTDPDGYIRPARPSTPDWPGIDSGVGGA